VSKLKIFIISMFVICLALIFVVLEMNKTVIKTDRIDGHEKNGDLYYIVTTDQNRIPSTLDQINELSDNTYVNVSYMVIYQESKWLKKQKKILKIIRFEREFPNLDNEMIDTDTRYYKLVGESIEDINEDHSAFIRLYERYTQSHRLWSLEPVSIIIPKVQTISEGKQKVMERNAELLRLLPISMIDDAVLIKWSNEEYDPIYEYTEESPMGLSIEDIIKTKH